MKLIFEGDTILDIANQIEVFLVQMALDGTAPENEEPEPEPKKTRKPKPEPEPEPDTDDKTPPEPPDEEGEDLAAVKKEALDKLMAVYLEGSDAQKAGIKELLKKFGVKKFSEVPEARAKELLTEAEKL
jgi:outer membrane biosynthesis protein TonB